MRQINTNDLVRVLLIEDNPVYSFFLQKILEKPENSIRFKVLTADRLAHGIDHLSREKFDIILLDLTLPDSNGGETVREIHKHCGTLPVVILTGFREEDMAEELEGAGSHEYVVKGEGDSNIKELIFKVLQRQ